MLGFLAKNVKSWKAKFCVDACLCKECIGMYILTNAMVKPSYFFGCLKAIQQRCVFFQDVRSQLVLMLTMDGRTKTISMEILDTQILQLLGNNVEILLNVHL